METRRMIAVLLEADGEGGRGGKEAGSAEWNVPAASVVVKLSSLSAMMKRALAMFTVVNVGNQGLGLHLAGPELPATT